MLRLAIRAGLAHEVVVRGGLFTYEHYVEEEEVDEEAEDEKKKHDEDRSKDKSGNISVIAASNMRISAYEGGNAPYAQNELE